MSLVLYLFLNGCFLTIFISAFKEFVPFFLFWTEKHYWNFLGNNKNLTHHSLYILLPVIQLRSCIFYIINMNTLIYIFSPSLELACRRNEPANKKPGCRVGPRQDSCELRRTRPGHDWHDDESGWYTMWSVDIYISLSEFMDYLIYLYIWWVSTGRPGSRGARIFAENSIAPDRGAGGDRIRGGVLVYAGGLLRLRPSHLRRWRQNHRRLSCLFSR